MACTKAAGKRATNSGNLEGLLKANFEAFRRGSSGLVAGLCWAVLGARVEATLTALLHTLGC